MTSLRQSCERSRRARIRTSAAIFILALPALAGCIRVHGSGRRATGPRIDSVASTVRTLEVRVEDDVLLTGQVRDDAIPGNALRRRSVARLPSTLTRALQQAGFRVVTTPRAREVVLRFRAHLDLAPDSGSDYVGRRYVFEGTTTLLVEHSGRLVEAIDVSVPLVELSSPADPSRVRRPGEAVDWRAYPDVLARSLVERLSRSERLAALARPGRASMKPTIAAHPVPRDSSKAGPPGVAQVARVDPRTRSSVLADADVRALFAAGPGSVALEQLEADARRATDPAARRAPDPVAEPSSGRTEAVVEHPVDGEPLELAFDRGAEDLRPRPQRREGAIAVFGIEDVSNTFGADVVGQLTDYLAVKVTEVLRQPVVARDELRQQLVAEKSKGYRDCVDQRCQIDLGRALSASRSLSTKLLRVGSTCAITLAMWDLETELAEHATSMRTECGEQAILSAIDRVVAQLGVPRGAELEGGLGRRGLGAATLSDGTGPEATLSDGTGPETTLSDGTVTVSTPIAELRAGILEVVPVRIELRAPTSELAPRPKLNLALVLDTSSSMLTEGRIQSVRKAALVASRALRSEDALSIVSFAAAPKVLLPSSRGSARPMLGDLLAGMNVGGRANLGGGLQAALRELAANRAEGTISHLLVVTDSPLAEGQVDAPGLEALAQSVARAGASMTIVGLGADVDAPALARLAELAGGRFTSSTSPDGLPGLFARELGALASVSMSDVVVEVRGARGVELTSVAGRSARPIRGGLRLGLGALASAEVLRFDLALRGRCERPGPFELARIHVRYRDWGDAGRTVVRDEPLTLSCGADDGRATYEALEVFDVPAYEPATLE
jgi:Mg-chelatase subunit ChlD